jgi:hypothetical protein
MRRVGVTETCGLVAKGKPFGVIFNRHRMQRPNLTVFRRKAVWLIGRQSKPPWAMCARGELWIEPYMI